MHLESQRMPPAGLVRPFAIARPAGPGLPFPRAPASVLPSPGRVRPMSWELMNFPKRWVGERQS